MSITKIITRWVSNYESQASVGSRFRAKRIPPLLKMIETVFRENGAVNMIDVGGTEKYWGIVTRQFLGDNKVSIMVVNLPGPASPEDHDPFKFVEGDGCDLAMFDDHSFHTAHSNSV